MQGRVIMYGRTMVKHMHGSGWNMLTDSSRVVQPCRHACVLADPKAVAERTSEVEHISIARNYSSIGHDFQSQLTKARYGFTRLAYSGVLHIP